MDEWEVVGDVHFIEGLLCPGEMLADLQLVYNGNRSSSQLSVGWMCALSPPKGATHRTHSTIIHTPSTDALHISIQQRNYKVSGYRSLLKVAKRYTVCDIFCR